MFGLLKKKFKDLSDKIFGKSQEKIDSQDPEEKIDSQEEKTDSSDQEEKIDSQEGLLEKEAKEIKSDDHSIFKESSLKDESLSKPDSNFTEISKPEESDIKTDLDKEKIDVFDTEKKKDVIKPKVKDKKDVSDFKVKESDIEISNLEEPKIKEPQFKKDDDLKDNDLKDNNLKDNNLKDNNLKDNNLKDNNLKDNDLLISDESDEKSINLGQDIHKTSPSITEEPLKDSSQAYKDLESKKVTDVKKSTFTKIKGIFSSKIKLSESELSSFLDDFEISLLEADVSIDSANAIINDLKTRLVDFSFSKSNLLEDIKQKIKETLKNQLDIDCEINNYIKKEKEEPLIILFIGPNGAGKTTTISKFAHNYKNQGKSIVLASSDTFRAGSIDQLEIHAKRIGVKVVKQNYGSDPAAVAYDAVSSAKSNKNDIVLIDTAGRQDTNKNLMQELSKIKRVVKPHLTIYIGESQSGQVIVEQIEKFDKEIGITGVILTKIDTDPKGGVAISILNELKKPIFYIGTGQEYNDLEKFSPEYIIERII